MEERYPNYVAPVHNEEDDDDCKSTTFALSRASLRDDTTTIRKRRDSRDEINNYKKVRSRNITKHRQQERSKWHQIVMHASSAAGTTAAVISEESMKCLKYCLNWLHVRCTPTKKSGVFILFFFFSMLHNILITR